MTTKLNLQGSGVRASHVLIRGKLMSSAFKGNSKGIAVSIVIVLTCLASPAKAVQTTFVERCLAGTDVLAKNLTCVSDGITVRLQSAGQALVAGSSKLPVSKIQHWPQRIGEAGLMDESIKFIAVRGKSVVTLEVPCGQKAYAYVSIVSDPKLAAYENVMECH